MSASFATWSRAWSWSITTACWTSTTCPKSWPVRRSLPAEPADGSLVGLVGRTLAEIERAVHRRDPAGVRRQPRSGRQQAGDRRADAVSEDQGIRACRDVAMVNGDADAVPFNRYIVCHLLSCNPSSHAHPSPLPIPHQQNRRRRGHRAAGQRGQGTDGKRRRCRGHADRRVGRGRADWT